MEKITQVLIVVIGLLASMASANTDNVPGNGVERSDAATRALARTQSQQTLLDTNLEARKSLDLGTNVSVPGWEQDVNTVAIRCEEDLSFDGDVVSGSAADVNKCRDSIRPLCLSSSFKYGDHKICQELDALTDACNVFDADITLGKECQGIRSYVCEFSDNGGEAIMPTNNALCTVIGSPAQWPTFNACSSPDFRVFLSDECMNEQVTQYCTENWFYRSSMPHRELCRGYFSSVVSSTFSYCTYSRWREDNRSRISEWPTWMNPYARFVNERLREDERCASLSALTCDRDRNYFKTVELCSSPFLRTEITMCDDTVEHDIERGYAVIKNGTEEIVWVAHPDNLYGVETYTQPCQSIDVQAPYEVVEVTRRTEATNDITIEIVDEYYYNDATARTKVGEHVKRRYVVSRTSTSSTTRKHEPCQNYFLGACVDRDYYRYRTCYATYSKQVDELSIDGTKIDSSANSKEFELGELENFYKTWWDDMPYPPESDCATSKAFTNDEIMQNW